MTSHHNLPTGRLSLDEVVTLLAAENNIPRPMVLVATPDMQGRLQGKRVSLSSFAENVVEHGMEMCAYVLATDTDMRTLDGYALTSWADGYADLRVRPDITTLRNLAGSCPEILVFADPQGSAAHVAPRTLLRRELDLLEGHGLRVAVGLESEFVLYHGTPETAVSTLLPAASHNLDYSLDHPPAIRAFLRALEPALTASDLPLEATKTEGGRGQVEVTFRYGDALEAADQHLIFKRLVRHAGEQTGLAPTFMSTPQTGLGSGLHVHISLWNGDQATITNDDRGLLPTGLHAVAGLLEALPQLMPLMLPTSNSYKRLRRHSFAPTTSTWGWDNRTCAVRVVGRGRAGHLEVRVPGADANPYLALTAIAAACRYGLENELQPPKHTRGSAYDTTDSATALPRTLDAALAAFTASDLASDLLGRAVVTHYATATRHELDALQDVVTDAERNRGFSRT
ncbi:glutamine synthetase family protein [Streptomyces sp. H10-C2]|uniref:glutamine synthetase family protein n=1 Tax=unclassified Streptomyces TaxID=2593676 RepID=UPI0024B95BD4|nr:MULTISPECIES: glutamine synthetase family protein [unclassified Streptomyces]MDJ0342769.1 glutamine synthetase family protein [Streptomyces sp. PH10-H1]MDJ0372447.1 glutamine synthetase family protein [Streptomyces sp. H10-C2]